MTPPPAEVQLVLHDLGLTAEPCGSQVTCDPPPPVPPSDYDYLIVIPMVAFKQLPFNVVQISTSTFVQNTELLETLRVRLLELGFHAEGEDYDNDDGFHSWRRNDVNLILCTDGQNARRHRAATALCRRLNVMDKKDRRAVFRAVLYAEKPQPA